MLRRTLVAAAAALALGAGSVQAETVLKVGVTAGPAAEILEQVVPIAKENGLTVKVIEFQDYIQPNAALDQGDLQANIYQTMPFLNVQNKDRGYHLVPVGKAFTLPMAVYSKKVKDLKDLPQGAKIGIPNDQAMGARALILLEKGGVIKLRDGSGLLASRLDIIKNPKKIKIVELEAAQLPRSLDDLTASAVNGNYAAVAGLNPSRDGLLVEGPDGPYVCNIVVNAKDKDKPWVKPFVQSYQDKRIAEWIKTKYKGSVIAGF